MSNRSELRRVLEAIQRFGWDPSGDVAERVAASLPLAWQTRSPAAALGELLDGDFLARNRVTRAEAGAKLAAALQEKSAHGVSQTVALRAEVLFVTALEAEHAAIEAHLREPRAVFGPEGGLYTVGVLPSAPHVGIAVVQTGPGNELAGVETERAIRLFQPRLAMFVGVAGGLGGTSLGTVVAATDVYGYATVAEEADGQKSRGKSAPSSARAVHAARKVARDGTWQRLRIRPASGWPTESLPEALVKPIAAGPVLLKTTDGPTGSLLRERFNDAIAVEMEGWGFAIAVLAHSCVTSLVVRGISDRVSDKSAPHDRNWQPAAAANAAAFAVAVALVVIGTPEADG